MADKNLTFEQRERASAANAAAAAKEHAMTEVGWPSAVPDSHKVLIDWIKDTKPNEQMDYYRDRA